MSRAVYDVSPNVSNPPKGAAPEAIAALRDRLLPWYARHRRDLPWRRTRDPYALVVAELMLQQTGVDRIAPRWTRFLEHFPSWDALAAASPGDVIREWRGLGYNRRAVNLHRMATAVVQRFGGQLPADRALLLRLPGVGSYTANAILSFVHGQDVAAIDVNLRRVIGRVTFGDGRAPMRDVEAVAQAALPTGRSGDWNQGLMDFAALQCTLRRPACLLCPLRDACQAVCDGEQSQAVSTLRRVGERRTAYVGSTRYLRGRVVDVLRALPPGDSVTASRIGAALASNLASNVAVDADLAVLIAGLVRDGLIAEHAGVEEPRYRLP